MKDKKKLLVILALGAVMVGMGAFTLLGSGSQPAPAPAAKKAVAKTGATVAGAVPGGAPGTAATPEADVAKNPLYAQALPQRDPFKEAELGMVKAPTVPPMPVVRPSHPDRNVTPVQVPVPMTGQLPTNIGVQPDLVAAPPFGYRVSGVIVGARPAAVFTDAQGNQRLVMVGASLDGDSKVIGIERNQVTVDYRGKTLRLTLGGTPNEK